MWRNGYHVPQTQRKDFRPGILYSWLEILPLFISSLVIVVTREWTGITSGEKLFRLANNKEECRKLAANLQD